MLEVRSLSMLQHTCIRGLRTNIVVLSQQTHLWYQLTAVFFLNDRSELLLALVKIRNIYVIVIIKHDFSCTKFVLNAPLAVIDSAATKLIKPSLTHDVLSSCGLINENFGRNFLKNFVA